MKSQPDKLFRDKLHNYQRPLSPDVWSRVSGTLYKRNVTYLWLKIAASVLLIAASTFLIFLPPSETPPLLSDRHTPNDTGPTIQPQPEPIPGSVVPGKPEVQQEPEDNTRRSTTHSSVTEDTSNVPPAPKTATTHEVIEGPSDDVVTDPRPQITVKPVETPSLNLDSVTQSPNAMAHARNDRESVTIIFSAEEVNEKYFTKNSTAQATPDDDGTSTLKKLLDKAQDLKHNQDPIGELRQWKNELFALNFRGDKQRKN